MKRAVVKAIAILPIGVIALLPKSALAGEKSFSPTSQPTLNRTVLIVDRNNNRDNNRWDNNRRFDNRWDNNRRFDNRWDNNRRFDNRWDNNRRSDNWRNDRYYEQYGNRRVWVPGHWERGLLGIGRRWVEGRWEYRR